MRHPTTGVGFLSHHSSSMTFVSADAVQWLIKHVEAVSNQQTAEDILEVPANFSILFWHVANANKNFHAPALILTPLF